jgi:hypothetical protein
MDCYANRCFRTMFPFCTDGVPLEYTLYHMNGLSVVIEHLIYIFYPLLLQDDPLRDDLRVGSA